MPRLTGKCSLSGAPWRTTQAHEAVFRWLSAPEKIDVDVFVARIPFVETRTYVERVLGNLARYQYLSGGGAAVSALNLDLPRDAAMPDDVF